MISGLQGTVVGIEKRTVHVALVSGICYEVLWCSSGLESLALGTAIQLHTHLVVREDGWQLYGFRERSEITFFKSLLKVSGVGPKLAQTIVSVLSPDDFATLVLQKDLVRLSKLPGIGKKTAERLLMEMRDRVLEWDTGLSAGSPSKGSASWGTSAVQQDAAAALKSLGYSTEEVRWVLSVLKNETYETVDVLLKDALKQFALQGA